MGERDFGILDLPQKPVAEKTNKPSISSRLHDALFQKEEPNIFLLRLHSKLWHIYGSLHRAGIYEVVKDRIVLDKTIRSLMQINKLLSTIDLEELETLSQEANGERQDALDALVPNKTKIAQYSFVKETYSSLYRDIKRLQEKIADPSIQYMIKNGLGKARTIDQDKKIKAQLFLSEIPGYMNSRQAQKEKALELCSLDMKEYLMKYNKEDPSYYPQIKL